VPNLLLEIGTEELPAGYIGPALVQMNRNLLDLLKGAGLQHGEVKTAATPRRLTLFVADLPPRQDSKRVLITGPPAKVAFTPDGKPTKAAEGFARAKGVDITQLEVRETPKGKYCCAVKEVVGRATLELLPDMLSEVISSVSFPKSMVWKGKALRFARPIRWLLALLGDDVVDVEIAGVKSGRTTYGHPFLAPGPVEIKTADFGAYRDELKKHMVVVEIEERRRVIRREIMRILSQHEAVFEHEALLREVANLVEWPGAIEGKFNPEFLQVPAAVVEAAMTEHQRYFPVKTADGKLKPAFIVISNRGPTSSDVVREGNERVLTARLADARFFWDEDRRTPLLDKASELSQVLFQKGLGSYLGKAKRLAALSAFIARNMGLSEQAVADVQRAARLCKADLVTQMVGEFPSLQGVMGGIYAVEAGESREVAQAIAEHYRPGHSDDQLPKTALGTVLSLADKFDNITGCFVIGEVPTGSQDPYALRRQAMGIIRMLEAAKKPLGLGACISEALRLMPENVNHSDTTAGDIHGFFRDRLYQMCVDRGFRYDIVNSVLAAGYDDISDFFERLRVVSDAAGQDFWPDLVFLVQRSSNVAKIGKGAEHVSPALFQQEEERALWDSLVDNKLDIEELIRGRRYEEATRLYCDAFAREVHNFFDKVFVNVDDEAVKRNRITLVKEVNQLYTTSIADLAHIVIEGESSEKTTGGEQPSSKSKS